MLRAGVTFGGPYLRAMPALPSGSTLRDRLERWRDRGGLNPLASAWVAEALTAPFAWPAPDEPLRAAAEALAPERRPDARTLHSDPLGLGVAVGPEQEGLLVLLHREGGPYRHSADANSEATRAFRAAGQAAERALTHAFRFDDREAPIHFAPQPRSLGPIKVDGASFGLAFGLLRAAWQAALPLPVEVAALATLDGSGRTGPVAGLETKLKTLHGEALAVRRVLVAPEQESLALGLVRSHGLPLGIEPVASLAEALALVWPRLTKEPAHGFESLNADLRGRALLELTEGVLDPKRSSHAAEALLAGVVHIRSHATRLGLAGDAEEAASATHGVLRRHLHNEGALSQEAALMGLGQPRAAARAHRIQHEADRADPSLQATLIDSQPILRASGGSTRIALLGAMGRALLLGGTEERRQGFDLLTEAVEGAFAQGRPREGHRAACALLQGFGEPGRKAGRWEALEEGATEEERTVWRPLAEMHGFRRDGRYDSVIGQIELPGLLTRGDWTALSARRLLIATLVAVGRNDEAREALALLPRAPFSAFRELALLEFEPDLEGALARVDPEADVGPLFHALAARGLPRLLADFPY